MAEQTLEQLQAYHDRLETDVRRSRRIDPDGLNRSSILVQNLVRVEEQIRNHPSKKK